MNIENAEISLVRFVAARCGMTVNSNVFRGELPPGTTGAAVRFTDGHAAGADLAEFSAAVFAAFDEPAEARTFADALWGGLPVCNTSGFTRIAAADDADGRIKVAFAEGKFTVAGGLSVAFY